MKFVSKNSNLRVVLKNGIPSEPVTGRLAVSGLYVKFENGVVNINDEEMSKMLLAHPGFGSDFICVDEGNSDPFASTRGENEPAHNLSEIQYGQVGKSQSTKVKPKLTPEMEAYVVATAKEIAKQMLKDLAESKSSETPVTEEASEEEKEEVVLKPKKASSTKKKSVGKKKAKAKTKAKAEVKVEAEEVELEEEAIDVESKNASVPDLIV